VGLTRCRFRVYSAPHGAVSCRPRMAILANRPPHRVSFGSLFCLGFVCEATTQPESRAGLQLRARARTVARAERSAAGRMIYASPRPGVGSWEAVPVASGTFVSVSRQT